MSIRLSFVHVKIDVFDNFEISIDEILAIVKSHSDSSSVPSAVCKKLYRCKSVEKDL